jgi:hypothetical protein
MGEIGMEIVEEMNLEIEMEKSHSKHLERGITDLDRRSAESYDCPFRFLVTCF